MGQQVANRDARRVVGRIAQRLQLRHVALGGIVEGQPALVAQLHYRHRGEAFRHRGDAEHGVGIDRRTGGDVPDTCRTNMGELPVDHNPPGRPGHVRRAGEPGEQRIDGGKGAGEPRSAIGLGELLRRRRGDLRDGRGREKRNDPFSHRTLSRASGFRLPASAGLGLRLPAYKISPRVQSDHRSGRSPQPRSLKPGA
jgi:hypothetical protein